jgi:16S rRNA (uracil1498-N3)-methyltransferase
MHVWRVVVDDFLPEVKESILLPMDESHYLSRVLRLSVGSKFELTDGQGNVALAIYDGQTGSRVYARILELRPATTLKKDLRLFLAQPDRKALEEVCYHASSVGFSQVVIFVGDHSKCNQPVKIKRLESLVRESLRFSKNPWLPTVFFFGGKLYEGLMEAIDVKTLLFCDESAKAIHQLKDSLSTPMESIGVLIGPEAGWSAQETKILLKDKRTKQVSLGPWIQKVPKAALNAGNLINSFL